MMFRRFFFLLIGAVLVGWGLGFSAPVFAQLDTGLEAVGGSTLLPDTDPRIIAANIINVFLGLLGIIFLGIILYAGFLWMTSGGDPAKTDRAKKLIRNGIIGIAIILSAWAIATYIIGALIEATTGGGGGTGGTGAGSGGGTGFGSGGGGAVFRVLSATPQGDLSTADLVVRILFSQDVSPSALSDLTISPAISGQWTLDSGNSKRVLFVPQEPCPGVPSKMCFAFNTEYTVTIGTGFQSDTDEQIRCGGFYPDCTFTFTAGDTVDTSDPSVSILNLYDGKSVPVDSAVEVLARATDNVGISGMEWSESGSLFYSDGPTQTPSPTVFELSAYWDTVGKVLKQPYTITVQASDLDQNIGSRSAEVIVLSQHCFDEIQNEDEEEVDCGGGDCLACSGNTCTTNADCSSGVCQGGSCVERPVITAILPETATPGSYVAIWGDNFGSSGSVTFLGPPETDAFAPAACTALGTVTWSDSFALVEVPVDAVSGPIRLTNAQSSLSDQTDDDRGPILSFVLGSEAHPGLCGMDPETGLPGNQVFAVGNGFGTSPGRVEFGSQELFQNFSPWQQDRVGMLVPVVVPGSYSVAVEDGSGQLSNRVPFRVSSPTAALPAPVLTAVDPPSGPRGEYVTLIGENFGYTPGTVRFYDPLADQTYVGDTSFPDGCAENWWRDSQILVKVPEVDGAVVKPANFDIYIVRGTKTSNRINFEYTEGFAGPGICSLMPSVGPVGTEIVVSGERFGTAGPDQSLVFFNGVSAPIVSWQSEEVRASVPVGAETGDVFVRRSAEESNRVQYTVSDCREDLNLCDEAGGEVCCSNGSCGTSCLPPSFSAEYAWQFSTGVIPRGPKVVEFCDLSGQSTQPPSPTPWVGQAGGDAVCISPGPQIAVLFDVQLDWPYSQEYFSLKKCAGTGVNACDTLEDVPILSPEADVISTGGGDEQHYVRFLPSGDLEPDTQYYVFVGQDVRSADLLYGDRMEEARNCPEDGLGYCFRFRTRASTGPCEIGSLYLKPWKAYAGGGDSRSFDVLPSSKSAVCNLLQCQGFSFDWSVGSKAVLDPSDPILDGCRRTVIAGMQEAVNPPEEVHVTETISSVTNFAELYIRFIEPVPRIWSPTCNEACNNTYPWIQFNTSLDEQTVHADNVQLYQCANENCLPETRVLLSTDIVLSEFSSVVPHFSHIQNSFITIIPDQLLSAGTYYVVQLNGVNDNVPGSIRSQFGMPMSNPFEWKFRSRLENEICAPDAVRVSPSVALAQVVGERQLFRADVMTSSDLCSAYGQILSNAGPFEWTIEDTQVADFLFDFIDADGDLPSGCTAKCRATGADGAFGNTAQCGNGIVETTDDLYCVSGKTPSGQNCVLLPFSSGAGEQCDGAAGCSGRCLWNPVAVIPVGTCGNFTVDSNFGEACDPGVRCFDLPAGASYPTGAPCADAAGLQACSAAGGTCEVGEYRGCSSGCRNLGASSVEGTTCGEGTIGFGEDCDLGSNNGSGGCSLNCLHSGSQASVDAVCGNAVLEPGEVCEADMGSGGIPGDLPIGCDPIRCLHEGTSPCSDPQDLNCCGNLGATGGPESGEDCDDGNKENGDGCSIRCLFEGSDWRYEAPSFCGNGLLERGEMCEVGLTSDQVVVGQIPNNGSVEFGTGDGFSDPKQIAEMFGIGTPDASGIIKTPVRSFYEGVTGEAIFGIQCGYTRETECVSRFGLEYGLDENGCCASRPELSSYGPVGINVCRNPLIHLDFETDMRPDSVIRNFIIAKEVAGTECPQGTTEVFASAQKTDGIWGWISDQWKQLWFWIKGQPAHAVFCAQTVSGHLTSKEQSPKEFVYQLDTALEPQTTYYVGLLTDEDLLTTEDDGVSGGILTEFGVAGHPFIGLSGGLGGSIDPLKYRWSFTTGDTICRLNSLVIEDTNEERPGYFTSAFESHLFEARAQALHNGTVQEIAPTSDYSWNWLPWLVNDPLLLVTDDQPQAGLPYSQSYLTALGVNGSAMVFAAIQITADTIDPNNANSTEGVYLEGAMPVTVFLCENPWYPFGTDQGLRSFRDDTDNPLLNGQSLFFNFQTQYCRDREEKLLPVLVPHLVDPDPATGLLRQYLFTFQDPVFRRDGIGIRVYQNLYHLTPMEWYRSQGFAGNPQVLEVDGYEAIREGGTVYASFANTNGDQENIYQNIFVLSHNLGAQAQTVGIFDQLVDQLFFNTNFAFDNTNVCVKNGADVGVVDAGMPYASLQEGVSTPSICTSDWDCVRLGRQPHQLSGQTRSAFLRCASYKSKLQRDIQRLQDYKEMTGALERYRDANGRYPVLTDGTYISGQTNSRWPSWQQALGDQLGLDLPRDPVDRLIACGFCAENPAGDSNPNFPCMTNEDCPGAGAICKTPEGQDPRTCWNAQSLEFLCPNVDIFSDLFQNSRVVRSRFYQYRALDGGSRFELASNFEIPPASYVLDQGDRIETKDWWTPAYSVQLKKCVTDSGISNGRWCQSNVDCKPCVNPNDPSCTQSAPANSCRPAGFRWEFDDICNNQVFGQSEFCGDGIVGAGEICELNDTRIQSCTVSSANDGFKVQVCESCTKWSDDPSISICRLKQECGNGRIDRVCSGTVNACESDADCATGVSCVSSGEVCDDGALNGTYGRCNKECTGFASYCGDGLLQPGEDCDQGSRNGEWCRDFDDCYGTNPAITYTQSCAFDCRGHAPYCGDGRVTSPEICDGNGEQTQGALCYGGSNQLEACQEDGDCPGGTCGLDGSHFQYDACYDVKITRCATDARRCLTVLQQQKLSKVSYINLINAKINFFADISNQPSCVTDASCGAYTSCVSLNNAVQCTSDVQCGAGGIQGVCRDYPTAHVRSCNEYDGTSSSCRFEPYSMCTLVAYCGDGIVDAGEECDDGLDNASFKACLPTCKKNTCGDGYAWLNVEECDNGANNGKQICSAQYGSTCNDCTTQCRLMTQAGGYCGDGIRQQGEECDGNEIKSWDYTPSASNASYTTEPHYILQSDLLSSVPDGILPYVDATGDWSRVALVPQGSDPITCQQMGYDFATNDVLGSVFEIFDADPTKAAAFSPYFVHFWGSEATKISNEIKSGNWPIVISIVAEGPTQSDVNQHNAFLTSVFYECGLVDRELRPNQNNYDVYHFYWKQKNEWPTLRTFNRCINDLSDDFGFRKTGEDNDRPYCQPNCRFSGCGRCTEEAGTGTIRGQVKVDGGSVGILVPGARVSLQYRGITVDQVLTDDDGYFEFFNLNDRSECAFYQLVAESFDDVGIGGGTTGGDEFSKLDSFTTSEFSVETFSTTVHAEVCNNSNACEMFNSTIKLTEVQ